MARILQRRKPAAEWTALNEILKDGEIGVVEDSIPRKFKIGDGITAWNNLAFSVGDLPSGSYQGNATPAMNPGTPSAAVFYSAVEAGTYANFGGVTLPENSMGFISWDLTNWVIQYFTVNNQLPARIDQNSNFQGANIDTPLLGFVQEIDLYGITISSSDILYIDTVRRAKVYTTPTNFVRHLIRIAINGVAVADWFEDGHTEPASHIETLVLKNSGGTAVGEINVNWTYLANDSEHIYNNSVDRLKARLNPSVTHKKIGASKRDLVIYDQRTQNLSTAGDISSSHVKAGTMTQQSYDERVEDNNIFKGTEIRSDLPHFIKWLSLDGVVASDTDIVHVYNTYRNFNDGSGMRWLLSFAINGAAPTDRICQCIVTSEPALNSKNQRIATLPLTALNNSGVTGTAVVDWEAITPGTFNQFVNTLADRKKALISPNIYKPRPSGSLFPASVISRGSSNVDKELTRMETSKFFKGSEIESYLIDFLLDFEITGLNVSSTDQVHAFWVWRGYYNGASPVWIFSIGINGVRVATCTLTNYTEPDADLITGTKIANLVLTSVGSVPGNTAVVGRATVDWSKASTGVFKEYSSTTERLKALLSPNAYKPKLPVVYPTPPGVARIETNNIFIGDAVDPVAQKFLLSVNFQGKISIPDGSFIYLYWAYRNYTQAPGQQRWIVAFGMFVNGQTSDRICQFVQDNKNEDNDAPLVNGKRVERGIVCGEINGSGITAEITVDWSAIPNGVTSFANNISNASKAKIGNSRVYQQTGSSGSKTNIGDVVLPNRAYTFLNDVDKGNIIPAVAGNIDQMKARQPSLSAYIDKFEPLTMPLNNETSWLNTGLDITFIASPSKNDNDDTTYDHPTPSVILSKSLTIDGGSKYNNKTITFPHVSTRESTGAIKLLKFLAVTDSYGEALMYNEGLPYGYPGHFWAVPHEQMTKCRIEYLLGKGYTKVQIESGAISPEDNLFNIINVGRKNSPVHAVEKYSIDHKGIQLGPFTLRAEPFGGWNLNSFMNKPKKIAPVEGAWNLMGFSDAFTGGESQISALYRKAWNHDEIVDTAKMREYVTDNYGFTGTTTDSYKAWKLTQANNPENPFFDYASTTTIVDNAGNTWDIRFSMAKYLSRYRTINNDGVRLAGSDPTKGTLVASVFDYDVTLPNVVLLNSCQNDGNYLLYGSMAKAFADVIKAEYAGNSWGDVKVIFSIADGSGTMFPKKYPHIDPQNSAFDAYMRTVHQMNLARAQAAISNEDLNGVYVLSNLHFIPTAEALIRRNVSSAQFDISGNKRDSFFIIRRTSKGIKTHLSVEGYRVMGIHLYALLKYLLGLL